MIYLDYNATTPLLPEAREAMLPFLSERFANPSSAHSFGLAVNADLIRARAQVAALLGVTDDPELTIVCTGGGTEALNMAFLSALDSAPQKRHIVISAVEHGSVRGLAAHYAKRGYVVTEVPVLETGALDLESYRKALRPDTVLVALMHANNETGVIFPMREACALAHDVGALFLCDAVASAGKISVEASEWTIDYLAVAAHKFYGPKGVGALYIKKGAPFTPLIRGGPQQMGRRGGTEPVAEIVGMGAAAQWCVKNLGSDRRPDHLRNRLEQLLAQRVSDVRFNGQDASRLPNTSNVSFKNVSAGTLLQALSDREIYASAGAACGTGAVKPSHVLAAMAVPCEYILGSLRLSVGHGVTSSDISKTVECVAELVVKLRLQRA